MNTIIDALTILSTSAGASYDSTLVAMDTFILYLSGSVNTGLELWRSDGTPAGTVLVTSWGQGVQIS